jgi:uncharacterized damage-inducible protein DinB
MSALEVLMSTTATQPTFTPEFANTYKDMLLGRIEHEQKTTRKVIDAVPNQKLDYKHDGKGRTALELAYHIVVSELWFLNGIADGRFEWQDPAPLNTKADILALYDKEFPKAMSRAKATTGDHLIRITDFFGMKMPTFSFIQFCQDHTVHHRGQLSTFLRPMGGKVPDIYGGSADEPFQG